VSDEQVLVGFAEAMAAIETTWSLQGAGFHVAAFHREGAKPAMLRIPGVEAYSVPDPELDAAGCVKAIDELVTALSPTAVLPLDDHALWACSQLTHPRVTLACPTRPIADGALDKAFQLEVAARAGLFVPPTQVMERLPARMPADVPFVVKPARALYEVDGRLQRPAGRICANEQEYEDVAARPWPGSVLVQPLIRGSGEGLFGHVGADGVVGWSAHRRLRMVNPQGSAASCCCSQPVDRELIPASERFLSDVGWKGLFMLEFLRDGAGRPWFMELNGRTWGSMALARRRGFEYPAWTVRAALDPSFEPDLPIDPPHVTCRNLGLDLVHLMFVARGPQSRAPMEWPRLGRAIGDVGRVRRGDRLYNWCRSQPGVLMVDTIQTLRQQIQKAVRPRR
jgi:hypothetical protein